MKSVPECTERRLVLDGKTMRGSTRQNRQSPACCAGVGVELQRLPRLAWVDQKQNEITALPDILRSLDLRGAVITMDAMGAQKTLLNQAPSLGGDVLVALKGNHPTLAKESALLFQKPPGSIDPLVHTETNNGHGRIERRVASVIWISLP